VIAAEAAPAGFLEMIFFKNFPAAENRVGAALAANVNDGKPFQPTGNVCTGKPLTKTKNKE
jgi:hypothetical protein